MVALQVGQYSVPFYELLRYFIPGFIIVALIILIYNDFYITSNDLALIFVLSLIAGFPINSFAPYKYIPGVSKLRRRFHRKLIDIILRDSYRELPIEIRFYISWDILHLVVPEKQYSLARRYLALGSLKLDIAFFLFVSLPLFLLKLMISRSLIILLVLLVMIYCLIVLVDDGKNDLVRSFNMILMLANLYIDDIYSFVSKCDCNELIKYREKRMYPKLPKI